MAITFNADTTNGAVITSDTSGEIELQANGVTKAKVTANGLQDANGNSLRGGSYRNHIINGDMRFDQRNNGASVTPASGGYNLDRWQYIATQASKMTVQQSSVAPSGFTHSTLITTSSAFSVGSNDIFGFRQNIEGLNISHLDWGTANAKTISVSFWVRSSLTGTFAGNIQNDAQDRSYVFSFTINSANTWEQKSVTITGDTTGTWLKTNGTGMRLGFVLGAGSSQENTAGSWHSGNFRSVSGATSVVGTSGATFYITGAQLEIGEGASNFEFLPYDVQLQRCQRYYEHNYGTGYAIGSAKSYPNNIGCDINGFTTTNGQKYYTVPYKVVKRAVPSVTIYDGNGNVGKVTTVDLGGTPTHNASIGLIFVNDQFVGAGSGNGTHSGINYFFVSSAEL